MSTYIYIYSISVYIIYIQLELSTAHIHSIGPRKVLGMLERAVACRVFVSLPLWPMCWGQMEPQHPSWSSVSIHCSCGVKNHSGRSKMGHPHAIVSKRGIWVTVYCVFLFKAWLCVLLFVYMATSSPILIMIVWFLKARNPFQQTTPEEEIETWDEMQIRSGWSYGTYPTHPKKMYST